MLDRLLGLEGELAHVESQLGDPQVTSDRNRFIEVSRRHSQLTEMIEVGSAWRTALEDAAAAREIGEANGWRRLMSNSAKITNILGGYGYETILNTMEKCVESACKGKIVV